MPKRRHRTKVTEKPVFTFRQMERVVDLIDRQAQLLTGEKVLPADDYVYAKNDYNESTIFIHNPKNNTYYFTLKARYPAIDNYYKYGKGQEYRDGVVGVYYAFGTFRFRIYLENTPMYAKFNPNDANHAESTITFYNIPASIVLDMNDRGYVEATSESHVNYYTNDPVDYFRDYPAGEDPP
jgi:hypothetical protein